MKRLVGAFVVLGLIGGAVWIGLGSRTEKLDPTLSINCGLSLCDDEAVVDAEIVVERCDRFEECHLVPYDISVFLGFIDLDDQGPDACGRGDCGAQIDALPSGWDTGRWRIVAPRIRRFPHLIPPEPIDLTLEAGETLQIRLVYRDPLNGWPRGPFAHNCLPQNADFAGDLDGDGLRDRIDFYPGYDAKGFPGWILRQRFGDGRAMSQGIDAECPEVIGAVDIDGDGKDELFYDTGEGMTAAVVDILKLHKGRLKNVIEAPDDFSLYVGESNAGTSDLDCYRTADVAGFLVLEEDPVTNGRSVLIYELRGRRLMEGIEDPRALRSSSNGDLNCFELHWPGY